MENLVHDMKNRYKDRYIIFDSSPVLVTAEPVTLSKYMDAIIFVVRAVSHAAAGCNQSARAVEGEIPARRCLQQYPEVSV